MTDIILSCWRSGQIDPADMVAMCRENPALEAALRAERLRLMGCARVEVKA